MQENLTFVLAHKRIAFLFGLSDFRHAFFHPTLHVQKVESSGLFYLLSLFFNSPLGTLIHFERAMSASVAGGELSDLTDC